MMQSITPSRIAGSLDAPPSKSAMQRAVLIASLADGETRIRHPSDCDDVRAILAVAEKLGAAIHTTADEVRIVGPWRISATGAPGVGVSDPDRPTGGPLDCGESATALRMCCAVAALTATEWSITGHGSLLSRPVDMIAQPLMALGAACRTQGGLPPVVVKGPLRGGTAIVDGSVSSQFLSGLLIALPCCVTDSTLEVAQLQSRPYVALTMATVAHFGGRIDVDASWQRFSIRGGQRYRAQSYTVPGDWSGAAFFLVAGAIAGEVEVRRLVHDQQADAAILKILQQAGARVEIGDDAVAVRQPARGKSLAAFHVDVTDCPDLVPPLVALACYCNGTSVITGTRRLRYKESDRAAVLTAELGTLGAQITCEPDRISATGAPDQRLCRPRCRGLRPRPGAASTASGRLIVRGGPLHGGAIDSHHDHRIAMTGAIVGLRAAHGVTIANAGCVAKSYPAFFADLASLTVKL